MNINQQIKTCIKEGDTGLAISIMLDFVKGKTTFRKLERDFMLLSSQFQQYEKKYHLGLGVEPTERNRIDLAILSLLKEIEDSDIKTETLTKQPNTFSKNIKIKSKNTKFTDESIQIGTDKSINIEIDSKETTVFNDKSQHK